MVWIFTSLNCWIWLEHRVCLGNLYCSLWIYVWRNFLLGRIVRRKFLPWVSEGDFLWENSKTSSSRIWSQLLITEFSYSLPWKWMRLRSQAQAWIFSLKSKFCMQIGSEKQRLNFPTIQHLNSELIKEFTESQRNSAKIFELEMELPQSRPFGTEGKVFYRKTN